MAISGTLMNQMAVAQGEGEIELDKLKIEEDVTPDTNPYAVPGVPYLAESLSDPRRTRPLAETPQTFTVLTSTVIEESGRSDLREILDGQPGITLGTGENGNAFGDRYIIRGHEARSDMFVDGLRDPGMTIRESFAVEQLEISKGPSSTFAGRGTTGGAVNSATKRASAEFDFSKVSAGLGTDSYHRVTLDSNKVLSPDTAVRVNLLHAAEDVPDRSPADRERQGVALSLAHQATDRLQLTADYYHFDGEDNPDLGTYLEDRDGDGIRNDPVHDIPSYVQDEDFLESTVDTFTLRAGYEVDADTSIVNLTRYGTTDNGYLVTGARGGDRYSSLADAIAEVSPYATITPSTHQGWQEVEYFANQLNYITDVSIGNLSHEIVLGAEYSSQQVLNGVYENDITGGFNCFSGESVSRGGNINPPSGSHCLTDRSGNPVSNINNLLMRNVAKGRWDADWKTDTLSLSLMDTVDVTDAATVFGGLRYDHYDYSLETQGSGGDINRYGFEDGYWNGHLGASFAVSPTSNVYASYSTATNLNGGESDVGTNGGYGGFIDAGDASAGAEETRSLELGTKVRLNNGKLLATAAVFQITKDDVMESQQGGYDSTGTANTGKNQVQGIELGLSGNLTDKLSAHAGLTIMDAEVLESIDPDNVGETLANFADNSATIQLRYQVTPKLALGGSMTYESERFTGQPDSAASDSLAVPDYTVFDAFAIYRINRDLKVRVNVNNVFDEDYYLTAYRSGAFTYIGDARSATVSLDYQF